MSNIIGGPSADEPGTEPASDEDVGAELVRTDNAETAVDRARLYSLLSIGLDRPGDELDALLSEGEFGDELRDAATSLDDPDVLDRAEAVVTVADDADVEDLYHQWGSLFGVEEGVTVSPYELTYLPGPLMTTTRDLADISGFYRAFGLRIAEGENDRADHVVFQTEFLGHLSLREAALLEERDDEGIAVVVDAYRSFVEDHLGRWYWRLTDEVSKQSDGFYAALADLLAALVESEVERLDVDPDWVPDDPEVAEWTEDVFGDSGRGCGGCGIGGDGDAPGGAGVSQGLDDLRNGPDLDPDADRGGTW